MTNTLKSLLAALCAAGALGCGSHGLDKKHLGADAPACCLVTSGASTVAYLTQPTLVNGSATGQLHVATADGRDLALGAAVQSGAYLFAPDGKTLFFSSAANKSFALSRVDLASGAVTTLLDSGLPSSRLASEAFFSPTSNYFLIGARPTDVMSSADLHVFDTRSGAEVYTRLNGGFNYLQAVLADDTLIFQDTVGGTDVATPPVQTLFWISLPNAATAPAVAITTRTALFGNTVDAKTLFILRNSGELLAWDTSAKRGAGTTIASDVVNFAVGNAANGPLALLHSGGALEVVGGDGTKMASLPSAKADPFGPLLLGPGAQDLYYFQNVETQNSRGTLFQWPLAASAPNKIGEHVSIRDLYVGGDTLVAAGDVDDLGLLGDLFRAGRDGSGSSAIGPMVLLGSTQVVADQSGALLLLRLSNVVAGTNKPTNGSAAIVGKLALVSGHGEPQPLDDQVHLGAFSFSDDAADIAFVRGTHFDTLAGNYVGALSFVKSATPTQRRDADLDGVSEIASPAAHSVFVAAPGAKPAGIYRVSY